MGSGTGHNMPSFWLNLKTLIGIFCGTVTAVLWGLFIWQLIVIFAPETTPPTDPPCFCQNNGICSDGICLCTEEWIGFHCEIVNFCDSSTYTVNVSQDILSFERIIVGRYGYSMEKCDNGTVNSGAPKATRMCTKKNGMPSLDPPSILNCNVTLVGLSEKVQSVNESVPAEIINIATDTQILTSKPEQLKSKDVSLAASIVEKILNPFSSAVPGEAAAAAVTTVSQLLDANRSVFSLTDSNLTNAATSLTMAMQTFSVSNSSTQEVVQPNIAVRTVALQESSATVLFSALKRSTNGLVSDQIIVDEQANGLKTDVSTEIQILINVTSTNSTGRERVGFVLYQNDRLFLSKIYKNKLEENYSNRILSGNVDGTVVHNVKIALYPQYDRSKLRLYNHACVFWDYSQNDWNTSGCIKETDSPEFLRCSCNHTTNFAVLMVCRQFPRLVFNHSIDKLSTRYFGAGAAKTASRFSPNPETLQSFRINYEYARPLEMLSYIGCGLSIAGLAVTILFRILTRKPRKMSTTLFFVSLCSSMLVFNIIFISGIENSNANKRHDAVSTTNQMLDSDEEGPPENAWCTAVAALLHYFLLATFVWTALNSVQLYLLLIKTQLHFPRYYSTVMSLTGWVLPALFVSITLAVTYEKGNYRQEEFCWLAALDTDQKLSIEKPMLWAFLLPVAIILLFNITVFVKIMVSVTWKENKALRSTKRTSLMKKLFTTLSTAVVLGITWILGYLMLIDHKKANIAFSYVFCIFSATQGLQMFIFHVVGTHIFKKKAAKIFASLSEIQISFHSATYYLVEMVQRRKKESTERSGKYEYFKPTD